MKEGASPRDITGDATLMGATSDNILVHVAKPR